MPPASPLHKLENGKGEGEGGSASTFTSRAADWWFNLIVESNRFTARAIPRSFKIMTILEEEYVYV